MRKIVLALLYTSILVTGCKKAGDPVDENADETSVAPAQRKCGSQEVLEEQMRADPGLRERMNNIENFIQQHQQSVRLLPSGIIEIPVVVNVIYKTNAQNISDAQIQSQITSLNQDFSATNTDYNSTPAIFQPLRSGDIPIRFVLAGVVRLKTKVSSWAIDDAMKKASKGGINPTDPTTKLNIWVCNLTSGYLGYAQFPGGYAVTDGVVIDDNAFGTVGNLYNNYNKGRTATHEIGHWLNLRHIWGDVTCGNDLVDDTPVHNTSNFGCPTNAISNCGGTDHLMMTMNYMDYTYDACMYMFTAGQMARMRAIFEPGGPRNSFAQP